MGTGFHLILYPYSFQDDLKIFFGGQAEVGLKILETVSPLPLLQASRVLP